MKKLPIYAFALIMIMFALSCNNSSNESADVNGAPPYTIKLEEYVNPNLPDLHSYTHAVYKDKIIMFGGRTNGLHGNSYQFDRSRSNKTIYVINTNNWGDPAKWTVSSMPASKIMMPNINTDQFIANNAEFFTNDSTLYVVGGLLGANVPTKLKDKSNPKSGVVLVTTAKTDDGKAPTGPVTLPYFTAIDLPALIDLVGNKITSMPANSMRQVMDTGMAITGGEVSMADKKVQLVFGWNFSIQTDFNQGDRYTHQIRTFTYKDDGRNLTITPITVCNTCWDAQPDTSTTGYFRRRDGSMSPMIDPADGSPVLLYYSGVFKDDTTNFDNPVWIDKNGAAEQNFIMRSNVYTCQVVPVYSNSKKIAYGTLLGGMKNANYIGAALTMPVLLTAKNDTIISATSGSFDHVPFSNQFTTVMVDAKHHFSQYLLPDSFPNTKTALTLPAVDTVKAAILPAGSVAYNGAESELIWTLNSSLMPHGVIDYDAFIKANPSGGVVGYLHGGILSALTNVFGTPAAHFSVASNRIFAVKLMPVGK